MKTVRTSPLGVAILGLLLAALPVQGEIVHLIQAINQSMQSA
jgi:hypothetical protein